MATGMLTREDLKGEVAAGTIDTVVAAMVDMQGRLVGKRFHAQFFADSGHEETDGCNYLLGVDIELEPVHGYKATSWEKGYGDLTPDRWSYAAGRRSACLGARGRPQGLVGG